MLSSIPKLLLRKMVIIRRGLVIFPSPPLTSRNLSEGRMFPELRTRHKNHWPGGLASIVPPGRGPPHYAALNIQNAATGGAEEQRTWPEPRLVIICMQQPTNGRMGPTGRGGGIRR